MKRKVVKQGVATLTVSLPSKWSRKFDLKNGDEINVDEQGDALIVTNRSAKSLRERQIDISDLYPLVNITLIKAYQHGHDEIKLVYNNPELLEKCQRAISELIGMEIVEQGNSYCVLKDIAGNNTEEFDVLYRRTFLLLKGMIEDGLSALKDKNISVVKNIALRDKDLNKFSNLCLRQLNKSGYKDFTKTPVIYSIIQRVEEIGDEYKHFFSFVANNNVEVHSSLFGLYDKIASLFRLCYEFSYNHSKENAKNIASAYDSIRADIDKQMTAHTDPNQIKALFFLKTITEKVIFIQGSQLGYVKE